MTIPDHRIACKAYMSLLLVSLLLLGACKSTHYELELRPQQDKLQRQLTTWVEDDKKDEFGTLDEETISRIAAAYQSDVPEDLKAKLRFQALVGPKMPNDVGGVGWYNYWPSSLGDLYSYSEQFGGNENLSIGMDRGMLAIDRLLTIVTLWVESEFDDARDLEQMTAALNDEIRTDLRNIFLHFWLDEASPAGVFNDTELLVRLAQYLSNHGYFEPTDMPEFYRATASPEDDDGKLLFAFIARGFAARMGVAPQDPLPPSVQALSEDWEHYEDSFEHWLENSEEARATALEWAADDISNIGLDEVGNVAFGKLFEAIYDVDLLPSGSTSIQVALSLPQEPLETNGEYEEDIGTITWSDRIADRSDEAAELPASFYAFWVEPATEFQEQHFGDVVIEGDDLAEYAMWENSLDSKQRKNLQKMLAKTDEQTAINRLREFRFRGIPDGDSADYAGIQSLLRRLGYAPDMATSSGNLTPDK